MSSRLKFEVTDIDALEKAHPDCVTIETRKVFDRSKVYAKIKAAMVLNAPLPGVRILTDEEAEVAEENKTAADSAIRSSDEPMANGPRPPKPKEAA